MDVQTLINMAGGVPELGAKLGVARTTIIGWREAGKIPASRVSQISEVMDLPLADVVKLAPQVMA